MWPFGRSTEARLKEALDSYRPLAGSALEVRVDGSTAVVGGEVPTERHRRLVESVARGLSGIEHVDVGGLVVAGDGATSVPAAAVDPQAVSAALQAEPGLADDPIDVVIASSKVRLLGAVDSQSEHDTAVAVATRVSGAEVDASALRVVENVRELIASNQGGEVVYTVQPGDTLSAIALKYYGSAGRSSYMRIAEHNGLDDPDLIRVGQTLVIPGSPDGPDARLG